MCIGGEKNAKLGGFEWENLKNMQPGG